MNILTVDLGTTNIKVAVFNKNLQLLHIGSAPVEYHREGAFVEFDPEAYFQTIYELICREAGCAKDQNGSDIAQIVLTGQAESLVLLDTNFQPARPAISWMDMRSNEECEEIRKKFGQEEAYHITGQPEPIPTWPATKLLWLRKNEPELFDNLGKVLLLKDYITYRLCGNFAGDQTVYSFSYYYDIKGKCFWKDMLNYLGIDEALLPDTMPSGTIAGRLLPKLQKNSVGLTSAAEINIGTLDHFAGMIGTGSIHAGEISESAGTVLSITVLTDHPVYNGGMIPNYCGPFPGTYVLLPVVESGGFCMEWYKKEYLPDVSYKELNARLEKRSDRKPPIFLPYLTGVNPPEFNPNAKGVFFGIHAFHDRFDLALSIMEGVACVLQKNLNFMKKAGLPIKKIVSTGGGAASPIWVQTKADFTGYPIEVPDNPEAPSLGAAMIGAVSLGYYAAYEDAIASCPTEKVVYEPHTTDYHTRTYDLFCKLYDTLQVCYGENLER